MRPRLTLAILTAGLVALACALPAHAQCPPGSGLIGPVATLASGPNPNGLAIADFDHDGLLDLAVTNSARVSGGPNAPGTLALFRGHGDGTFDPATTRPCGISPLAVTAAHLNGDTWVDLLVAGWGESRLLVFLGQSGGDFQEPVRYATGLRPHHLSTADFNGDGIVDVATANNGDGSVSVLLGRGADHVGDGTFAPAVHYPLHALSLDIATGDVDGDGIADLVATQTTDGKVAVLRGLGTAGIGNGAFRPAVYVAAGSQPYVIELADLDADTHPDLVVGEGNSAGVMVMRGRPDTTFFDAPVPFGRADNVGDVKVADVDKDGVPDIVAVYTTGNRLSVLRGHPVGGIGDGTFAEVGTATTGAFPVNVEAVELNTDGHLDFLATNYNTTTINVFPGVCDEPPPPPPAFAIEHVLDVPDDQGGRVFVTWNRHPEDVTGHPVNAYRVWRRIVTPGLATGGVPVRATAGMGPGGALTTWWWEALATLPAQRLERYGYTAATTRDSLPTGNPYTAFFVTALTSSIDVFYDTPVDSGYSVDNRRPATPPAFAAQRTGLAVAFAWEPCPDADVARYELHRGATADFTPGDATRVAAVTEPGWTDPTGAGGWWKLLAVDVHENVGAPASVYVANVLDAAPVVAFALHGVTPNPTRGRSPVVRYALPDGAPAQLHVFDAAGRRAWSRAVPTGPGEHALSLRDAGLPAGVYLLRLEQGPRSAIARVTLLP